MVWAGAPARPVHVGGWGTRARAMTMTEVLSQSRAVGATRQRQCGYLAAPQAAAPGRVAAQGQRQRRRTTHASSRVGQTYEAPNGSPTDSRGRTGSDVPQTAAAHKHCAGRRPWRHGAATMSTHTQHIRAAHRSADNMHFFRLAPPAPPSTHLHRCGRRPHRTPAGHPQRTTRARHGPHRHPHPATVGGWPPRGHPPAPAAAQAAGTPP